MTTPQRMALAFVCMLLGFAVFACWGFVPITLRFGLRHALPSIQMLPVFLLFTLPGWVLSLPFVIYFKNAHGWRAWAILAIGTTIGPCFLLGWTLLASGHINWQGDGAAVLMALFIGFFTTVFYVLLLRRFTTKTL